MRVITKLSLVAIVTVFASTNFSIATTDTGLGIGNGGAIINNTQGGFVNTTTNNGVANLNFQGDTHVNWDTFNINSNETMNFNAVNNSSGFTVLNTVNTGMSNICGRINIDPNIGKVILSNPNGVLFDGTKFDVAASNNFVVTTAQMNATFNNLGQMNITQLPFNENSGSVTFQHLKYNEFFIDGDFTIIAPKIFFDGSNGFKFVTVDGQNFIYKFEEDNSHIPISIAVSGIEPYEVTGNNSNNDSNNDSGNNSGSEVNVNVDPWEDSGDIVVGDEDENSNNNNNNEPEIEINANLDPWEDGGDIVVGDEDENSNTENNSTSIIPENTSNSNLQVNLNKADFQTEKNMDKINNDVSVFDFEMSNNFANGDFVNITIDNKSVDPKYLDRN